MPVTIPRTPWIDDDGTGTTGTILNNAVKTQLYDQIDTALAQVAPGAATGLWQAVPFNAANFYADSPMAWVVEAGDVAINRYTVIGKTLHWYVYLNATSITGTGTTALRIVLPGGYTSSGGTSVMSQLHDGTNHRGIVLASGTVNNVTLQGDPPFVYTPNANGTYIIFLATLEIL